MRSLNKKTLQWVDSDSNPELNEDWIIGPVFEDEARAMLIGTEFWTFDGNNVVVPTPAEYASIKLERDQIAMWRAIQRIRDARRQAGAEVGDYWFHSDDTSRIQQIGLMLMGASMPPGIMWKTMSGEFVEMTPALALQIFQAIATKDRVLFATAEQHRSAMMLLPDPTTYDYEADWPENFSENLAARGGSMSELV